MWWNYTLIGIFIIHAAAFMTLYIKRKTAHCIVFFVSFLFLIGNVVLNILEYPAWGPWRTIRVLSWIGCAIGTVLAIKHIIHKRRKKAAEISQENDE